MGFLENAVVGLITVIVELLLSVVMLVGKVYLDFWGPWSQRKMGSSAAGQGLTIPARARMEMSKFLKGEGAAAFPLMQAELKHTAAHLLLDCQLEFNHQISSTTIQKENTQDGRELSAVELRGGGGSSFKVAAQRLELGAFADMIEQCLEVAEVDVFRRQNHGFVSFRKQFGHHSEGGEVATDNSNLCFVPCRDGYVTVMWLSVSATLAVDFVAVAPETILKMNSAAETFCKELAGVHPGTKIMASALSRLPA